ncbi:Phosphatidylglycerol--prolipoprotein diacylglyceryl transferase [Arenibacter antarcticus]|uniref:FecR family protein n=1 Tax=Arenibacter antarcticus TaxID=2040469 RepID=A0ABW5VD79_9FLAO|nr:FecR domain-containing protein [Arenibacter sp. H213]MCM4169387.1 iron dicitrate transport regulator FecR [Arenibacter sp. H213]
MKSNYFDNLVVKYLNHSIKEDELDELILWLEEPGNKEVFTDFAKINYSLDYKLGHYDTEGVKRFLQEKIRKDKKSYKRRKVFRISKYAAILVVAVGVLFLFVKEKQAASISEPFHNEQRTTLELERGRSIILKEEATQDIVSEKGEVIGKHNQQGIQYEKTELSNLVFNTLKVPKGRKFRVTLSDGTKVFLNSDSNLKFPVNFISGENRTVFLSGEAYFEVTKGESPFVVKADNLDVRVLGTQFNVSAYSDDETMRTVLVEGSVELLSKSSKNNTKTLLMPEQGATWDKVNENISVAKADIASTTAWMKGQLIFNGVPFKDIIKKLERSYNCTIVNNNLALNEEVFTATFHVELESIEQVMAYISKNSPYQYSIDQNRTITIN